MYYFVVVNGMLINVYPDLDSAKKVCANFKSGQVWHKGKIVYEFYEQIKFAD